jgi:hypothetical protein
MIQRQFPERHLSQVLQDVGTEVIAVVAGTRRPDDGRQFAGDPFVVVLAHRKRLRTRQVGDLRLPEVCGLAAIREPAQIVERAGPDFRADHCRPLCQERAALGRVRKIRRFGKLVQSSFSSQTPPKPQPEEPAAGSLNPASLAPRSTSARYHPGILRGGAVSPAHFRFPDVQ